MSWELRAARSNEGDWRKIGNIGRIASQSFAHAPAFPFGRRGGGGGGQAASSGGGGDLIEYFSDQSTDASGNVNITLNNAPTSLSSVFVVCNNDRRVAHAQAVNGSAVTVLVSKLRYDRATLAANSASGAPTGVTIRDATTGVSTSANQSAGINPATMLGGGQAADAAAHTHTFNELWNHTHAVTQTETDVPIAASESGLNFVVIYR